MNKIIIPTASTHPSHPLVLQTRAKQCITVISRITVQSPQRIASGVKLDSFTARSLRSIFNPETIMSSITSSLAPRVSACFQPARRMDGFTVGPLPHRVSLCRQSEEKHRDVKHLAPKLARSRSLPRDHCVAAKPGHEYEEHHRRELLALGIFLTAAAQAKAAHAGQSNNQLADAVRFIWPPDQKGVFLQRRHIVCIPGFMCPSQQYFSNFVPQMTNRNVQCIFLIR